MNITFSLWVPRFTRTDCAHGSRDQTVYCFTQKALQEEDSSALPFGTKKSKCFFFPQFFSIRITLQDWQVQLSMYMILRRRERESNACNVAISSLIRGLLVASV